MRCPQNANSQLLENYLGQMYCIELEIKDTTESITSVSYRDLQLSIGKDGQNEMISMSTSQTVRSWVVKFLPRWPIAFLSLSLYDTHWLVPHMNVLLLWLGDTWSRPVGTCICSTCWDQSFSELVVILPDYALGRSLGTFSILLFSKLLT